MEGGREGGRKGGRIGGGVRGQRWMEGEGRTVIISNGRDGRTDEEEEEEEEERGRAACKHDTYTL